MLAAFGHGNTASSLKRGMMAAIVNKNTIKVFTGEDGAYDFNSAAYAEDDDNITHFKLIVKLLS